MNNQTEIKNLEQYQKSVEKHTAWQYNVLDKFKDKTVEEIKESIQQTSLPFAVLMQHVELDINMGNIVRSANFLGAKEIFYYGPSKRWDKRSSIGCYKYLPVQHLSSLEEVKALKDKYIFIGAENNVPNCVSLKEFSYPKDKPILFVLGEEQQGIRPELMELLDHVVEVPAFGSIRSLNVASAATLFFWDFISKYKE